MDILINNLSLSKQEMIASNGKEFENLRDTKYSGMLNELRNMLFEERKKYDSDIEFYQNIAHQFACVYIPQLKKDYGDFLSVETIQKLDNIIEGKGLMVLNPGDAVKQKLVSTNANGMPNGDVGAFARPDMGIIGFTPESESSRIDFSHLNINELYRKFPKLKEYDLSKLTQDQIRKLITIENAVKMIVSMIHETFHLLIGVKKIERFYYNEEGTLKNKLTSGGFILDEGLVDKLATDFANRHGFYHMPGFFYMDYVKLCDALEERIGSKEFNNLAFNCTYDKILSQILTPDEFRLYQFNERKKYFEKRGINNIDILLENNESLEMDSNKQL